MQPFELMINDFVMANKRPLQLRNIGRNITMHSDEVFQVQNLCPVPIDEDILSANGFRHRIGDDPTINYWRIDTCDTVVAMLPNPNDDRWTVDIERGNDLEIRFKTNWVHELQHALRLARLNEMADYLKLHEP